MLDLEDTFINTEDDEEDENEVIEEVPVEKE
jgi:hypothetical protein